MAKLSKLHLENFGCIKNIDIEFSGRDGKIVGANRIGKTTVINAICYLLSDKLLGSNADIPSIKNHADTRAKVVVEGIFYTDDGDVTLRKEFYEKWVRPRGSEVEELQGHSTDYFINGAKQARAKDFFEALASKFGIPTEISGMDAYQLAIDPFYLGQIICGSKDWKLASKAVIDLVGDVTAEEIYTANPNARIAKADLESHQYDDGEAKKAIRGEIDGYKKRLIENEGLLEEHGRALDNDVSDEDYATAQAEVERIDTQIAQLQIGADNPYAKEVGEIQQELYKLQTDYSASLSNANIDHTKSEAIRQALTNARDQLNTVRANEQRDAAMLDSLNYTLNTKRAQFNDLSQKLKGLGEQFKSIVVIDTCPTCGQKLPQEQVDEAVNKKKAELIEQGQKTKAEALAVKAEISELEGKVSALLGTSHKTHIAELTAKIEQLEKDLYAAIQEEKSSVVAPDPSIKARIDELHARLAQITKLKEMGSQNTLAQIQSLKNEKANYMPTFSKRIAADTARKRIAEIKADNIAIGKKLSEAEQRLWAVGEFVKTKLSLLDEHMARKLGEVRFQLIKENIKAGSYDEVCVPYIIDPISKKHTKTLFADGSKSEQIFTGIQIIKAIRDAKGWSPLPIVFDQGGELDAESTQNAAYYAEAQIIEVKVEGNAKTPTFVPFAN